VNTDAFAHPAGMGQQAIADVHERAAIRRFVEATGRCMAMVRCGACGAPQFVRTQQGMTYVSLVCAWCGRRAAAKISRRGAG
jgi:hypothetical protein